MTISIHTALAGCDTNGYDNSGMLSEFQSTQPSQAVTYATHRVCPFPLISIHTALAGCDYVTSPTICTLSNFNPHSPRRL